MERSVGLDFERESASSSDVMKYLGKERVSLASSAVWDFQAQRFSKKMCVQKEVPGEFFLSFTFTESFQHRTYFSNNSEGLSQKAKHPKDRLYELHGSLMDIKCSNKECDYYDKDNFKEPICPALAVEDVIEHFAPAAKQSSKDKAAADDVTSKLSGLTVKDEKKENEKTAPKPAPNLSLDQIPSQISSHLCPQ